MGKASFSVGKLTQHSQSHINRENGLNYAVVEIQELIVLINIMNTMIFYKRQKIDTKSK